MALVKSLISFSLFLISFCNAGGSTSTSNGTSTAEPSTTDTDKGSMPRPTGTWLSPEYRWFFQYPLPIPPQKQPKLTYYPESSSHAVIDYYEIEVKECEKQIYPDRPPTKYVGYDGQVPGPKFVMQQGREAVVRFTNNGPFNISTHVHGQYNRAPFDGWAADYATPGQYKDYYYPNSQNARSIWYHDHTEYTTGEHAYRGLAGGYILTDPQERSLELPKDDHDIALALSAKRYSVDGSLIYDTNNSVGVWGDVIQVNEQPWPYLEVEPRKYRLRLLNGAVSRTFDLSLAIDHGSRPGTGKDIQFNVIGSDGGLLSHPVPTKNLALAMGERYEIVVDFAGHAGKNITMKNARGLGENIDYAATDLVMRFCVGKSVTDDTNNGDLPSQLRFIPPPPNIDQPAKDFTFERIDDEWLINGVGFEDIEHRILAKPKRGTDEIWVLKNGNGNGTHPVHIHLVDFQVLSRTGGRDTVLPWEAAGMKDVVWLGGGETVQVVARYAPWDGVYMFHCHNLVHEDHDMLVAFNVTQLAKWGYDNSTIFIDPMQPEFRPKNIDQADYEVDAIMKKLAWFYSTNAYNHGNAGGVSSALDAYSGEIYSMSSTLKTLPSPSASASDVTTTVESSADASTNLSEPTTSVTSSTIDATQETGYAAGPSATSTST